MATQTHRCEICGNHVSLTVTAKRWLLLVHAPRTKHMGHTHWLCEDCVKLFSPTRWHKTRKALRQMLREQGYDVRGR